MLNEFDSVNFINICSAAFVQPHIRSGRKVVKFQIKKKIEAQCTDSNWIRDTLFTSCLYPSIYGLCTVCLPKLGNIYIKNVKSSKVYSVIVLSFFPQARVSHAHFKRFHGFAKPQLPQVVE